MRALNKWVAKVGDRYVGLVMADTREDAEDWLDELGLEIESDDDLMTIEQYRANHEPPEVAQARADRVSRIQQYRAKEEARKRRVERLKRQRRASRLVSSQADKRSGR